MLDASFVVKTESMRASRFQKKKPFMLFLFFISLKSVSADVFEKRKRNRFKELTERMTGTVVLCCQKHNCSKDESFHRFKLYKIRDLAQGLGNKNRKILRFNIKS